jgi:hypothetical protein
VVTIEPQGHMNCFNLTIDKNSGHNRTTGTYEWF